MQPKRSPTPREGGAPDGAGIPDWLSAADAASRLGVKRQTLYAYASRGHVRTAPVGPLDRRRMYCREDVERLLARSLARSGHTAVAAGALRFGEPVLETRIGDIASDGPRYRGRPALELARAGARWEAVCELLWGVPFEDSVGAGFPVEVSAAPRTPFSSILLVAAGAAAHPARDGDPQPQTAGALARSLAAAPALGDARPAEAYARSRAAPNAATSLLWALGASADPPAVAAVDEALVLAADHELNASTFAARIAAGAGASLAACVLAALATLSGTRHGAVTRRVEAMVSAVERPERAAAWIRAQRAGGESVAGFGHPLYPEGDPRGARLLALATSLGPDAVGVRVLRAVVDSMALATGERPTLDIGLVALAGALGLPPGSALALFACGRVAGWLAHALEQRESGHLLRPRALYVGDA